MSETQEKLEAARAAMPEGVSALRLKGTDWFAWACAGGSNAVLLAAETGVAEVLITRSGAFVLTNSIEAERLKKEELPPDYSVFAPDWPDSRAVEDFVAEQAGALSVSSDRPAGRELPLPDELLRLKRRLLPQEVERYRRLGRDAASAMGEVLSAASPDWSEDRLAAEGAKALLERGIAPALILAGGQGRVERYRHPTPTAAPIGDRAMLVFCARRHGLYANLTRFVYFRQPHKEERARMEAAARVESAAFAASVPGAALGDIFTTVSRAYEKEGFPREQFRHHQGGTTGYLSREVVAAPDCATVLEPSTALAWNPSLPGAKIEDTVLLGTDGLEVLTRDERWPVFSMGGLERPDILVR